MKNFILAFVPLFVSVDAFGLLPIFISMTEGINGAQRKRVIFQSTITAFLIAVSFVFLGKAIFSLLGITVADFMIAGGVLLFVIALVDLLSIEKKRMKLAPHSIGPVPLGTPLMVGPAVLTTSLMLVSVHGPVTTVTAIIANIAIAGMIFYASEIVTRVVGLAGTRALSKIASLLLAAIAVMMVRKGIFEIAGILPPL